MLDECSPGNTRTQRMHNWLIKTSDGKTYPSLPVGEHGARRNVSVQVGHVKRMVRRLGIFDCAKTKIPRLA